MLCLYSNAGYSAAQGDRGTPRGACPENRVQQDYYVRQAILEHLEDCYLAVERLEQNLPGIPLDQVERRLGLQD